VIKWRWEKVRRVPPQADDSGSSAIIAGSGVHGQPSADFLEAVKDWLKARPGPDKSNFVLPVPRAPGAVIVNDMIAPPRLDVPPHTTSIYTWHPDHKPTIFPFVMTSSNVSTRNILFPFFKVSRLDGEACPCEVDGAGPAGSEIAIRTGEAADGISNDNRIDPGEKITHYFRICISKHRPFFNLRVDLMGNMHYKLGVTRKAKDRLEAVASGAERQPTDQKPFTFVVDVLGIAK
jgi:hypothetical protein